MIEKSVKVKLTESESIDSMVNFKKFFSLVIPYGLIVSTLYLLGYWGVFHVNIFEYASLGDILIVSLQQMIVISIFAGGGTIAGAIIGVRVAEFENGGEEPVDRTKGFFLWYDKVLFGVLGTLIYIVLPVCGLYMVLFTDLPFRWLACGILIAIPISKIIEGSGLLTDIVPNTKQNNMLISVLLVILLSSYGWGALVAHNKKSINTYVVVNDIESDKVYLGRAGDETFFWSAKTETVEIMATRLIDSLKYHVEPDKAFRDLLLEGKKGAN